MSLEPKELPSTSSEVTALDPKDNPDDLMKQAEGQDVEEKPSSSKAASNQPQPTPGGQEKDDEKNLSPLEKWVQEIMQNASSGPDTDQDPASSAMKQDKGQYNQQAQQYNKPDAGTPGMEEEAAEVVAENPEIAMAAAGG